MYQMLEKYLPLREGDGTGTGTPPAAPPVVAGDPPPATPPAATPPAATPAAPTPLAFEALKFPDGFEVDRPVADQFVQVMNDDKLSAADRAQRLIDLQSGFMKAVSEKANQAIEDRNAEWQKAAREDKEIGGEKLDPALGAISQFIDAVIPTRAASLRQMLGQTGAGNHPDLIALLHAAAKAHAEGRPAPATPSASAVLSEDEKAARMYPSMKQGA